MGVHKIVVLSLLITEVLSAPSGCLESCTYQSQTLGFQDHAGLSAANLQGSDYTRPGTWTEHNDYNVDNGHGKVHEEHGQIVDGPKTVRFYKKNYSSSYSSGYANGAGLTDSDQNSAYRHGLRVPTAEEILNSQRTYGRAENAESVAQRRYNTMQSEQYSQSSSHRRAQNERLEDLAEYGGNLQVHQQGVTDLNSQTLQGFSNANVQPGNWSKVDSYKTDGGRGRVYEEEGQFVAGPKKVRYYKKNYTSSYSSVDGIPITDGVKPEIREMHKELEKLQRDLGKGFRQITTAENIAASNVAHSRVGALDTSVDSLHGMSNHRDLTRYGSSSSTRYQNNNQQRTDSVTGHSPYSTNPQNAYGTNSYSMYEKHEGHVMKAQPSTQINIPTSGYSNVLSTGNSGYNKNTYGDASSYQQTDNVQKADLIDTHQSNILQTQALLDNLRGNVQIPTGAISSSMPGQMAHYKEHRSSSYTKEASVPQYVTGSSQMNHHMGQYSNNQYEHGYNAQGGMQYQDSQLNQFREGKLNSARNTHLGKLITGTLGLSQGTDTVDCTHDMEQTHTSSHYHRKYKRDVKYDKEDQAVSQHSFEPRKPDSSSQLEDLTQQTSGKLEFGPEMEQSGQWGDLTQQTSGKLEFGQDSQQTYQPWEPNSPNQKFEEFTQQVGELDDLTQQTSGKLELGQVSQSSYNPWVPNTDQMDDLTQQTSGKLELGQVSQSSYNPWIPNTDQMDDLTQQTSEKLEFGQDSQQSYQPWKPNSASQKFEDFTEQTDQMDDLTQQTSGKLEFGQDSQQTFQPWKPDSASQKFEDFTQQTGELEDLTQQTSGKLELGQVSQSSHNPGVPNTDQMDDLTQQTSEKLEFGQDSQQSYQPWKPNSASQKLEDLTQQTDQMDDLTQQTSGKLEFGQDSQQSYQPWKPNSANQKLEDLTQQTDQMDDLTQQTSGKLEFGQDSQQSYQPWKPNSANQKLEDLTQQTDQMDDLTQQTSGKLEFGQDSQQSYQPWKPNSANQKFEDLTQQTDQMDDLTQQTSGKIEFGQDSQQSYQPWKPNSANQKLEDLTQQTDQMDDLTQQTSEKIEFGQDSQQSYQPWKPNSASQTLEDLTQQTDQMDDLTQQTSGKLELGQNSQQTYQPWKPNSASQKFEDLTQQTDQMDDLTQQTSGKLELGQNSQQTYQPWKPNSASQTFEDLTQQISDDLTQQTYGKLEVGQDSQQTYQPWKPNSASQTFEDLTQQTSDDLTQQTYGKLEVGQESQQSFQPWVFSSDKEKLGGFSQQTGGFDDGSQQASGKPEFGEESHRTYLSHNLNKAIQKLDGLTQQVNNVGLQEGPGSNNIKPAEKPKPRWRYSKPISTDNMQVFSQNKHGDNNPKTSNFNSAEPDVITIPDLPPQIDTEVDTDSTRNTNLRGDQNSQSTVNQDGSHKINAPRESNGFDTEGGNADQVNWLHKSNDATVGLQWHYTYHPSDQRQFVQQTDQKHKETVQPLSQDKLLTVPQQSSDYVNFGNPYLNQFETTSQRPNPALAEGVKTSRRRFGQNYQQSKVLSDQQAARINEDMKKDTRSSDTIQSLEPRIIEAYGGGEYDPYHSDDVYSRARVNPSATLPPTSNVDPWYIREKPEETLPSTEESTLPPSPVEPLDAVTVSDKDMLDNTASTTPATVWSRIGHKITSTIDKARERARVIFG